MADPLRINDGVKKLISSTDSTTDIPKDSNVEPYENARRLSILRRQRKVLIVDDESTGRTILAKIIQQAEDDVSVDSSLYCEKDRAQIQS